MRRSFMPADVNRARARDITPAEDSDIPPRGISARGAGTTLGARWSLRASIFPRDAVVALVAFGATLVLIGVGHGPTRSIDVVGLALAALANLSPSVTGVVIDRMARQRHAAGAADERLEELTPREREVLELVARGLSNGEIASALVIEESTVKTHVKRILMKLGLRDRVHAVILAYDTGIASAR